MPQMAVKVLPSHGIVIHKKTILRQKRSLHYLRHIVCNLLLIFIANRAFGMAKEMHAGVLGQSTGIDPSGTVSQNYSPQSQVPAIGNSFTQIWLPPEKVKPHLKSDMIPVASLIPKTVGRYRVVVLVTINQDGTVGEVTLKSDTKDATPEVNRAVFKSVHARIYRPFIRDGKPVRVTTILTFAGE